MMQFPFEFCNLRCDYHLRGLIIDALLICDLVAKGSRAASDCAPPAFDTSGLMVATLCSGLAGSFSK